MSNQLARWLLWLLGIQLPPQTDAVQWQLEGAWAWSPGAVVLVSLAGLACATFVGWIYVRERSTAGRGLRLLLATLRFSALALVLLVMIYELRIDYSRTSLPCVALMVDESGSMSEQDDYDDSALKQQLADRQKRAALPTTNRLDAAKALLLADDSALLRELHRRYKVHVYAASGTIRRLPADLAGQTAELRKLQPTAPASRLGSDLQAVLDDLRGTEPAGLIYLGDGITTAGPNLAEVAPAARRRGTPLYMIATGSDKPARTIQLDDLLVDDVISVNDPVSFDCKLTATGLQDRPILLVLKDGKTGEVLDR
ncbi:MAG: hypothetical protein K8T25_09900, partial [Planctomycetia bacterium]|nr:hypothetical protein [Planctomycetia bacterium]